MGSRPTGPTESAAAFGVLLLGLVVLLTFALAWVAEDAQAHTPRPVACQFAWENAPAGSKWRARQVCLRGQANHRARHARALVLAKATRRCLAVPGSNMGSRLCAAIATVRPGWADDPSLHELLRRESGWNPNAVNERSGACGSFQRLPCPWRYYGGSRLPHDDRVYASALTQARNGLGNIRSRYGSPSRALSAHDAKGWY